MAKTVLHGHTGCKRVASAGWSGMKSLGRVGPVQYRAVVDRDFGYWDTPVDSDTVAGSDKNFGIPDSHCLPHLVEGTRVVDLQDIPVQRPVGQDRSENRKRDQPVDLGWRTGPLDRVCLPRSPVVDLDRDHRVVDHKPVRKDRFDSRHILVDQDNPGWDIRFVHIHPVRMDRSQSPGYKRG